MCFDTICPPPPGNDFCDAAVALPPMLDQSVPIDNNCAFTDFNYLFVECDNGFQPFGTDLWYSYVSPCDGPLTVSLCKETSFDTILAVYDGGASCDCPADDKTLVACGDDTCGFGGGPSVVTFDATADLAQRAGVSFAQFVMLQPLPGTIDFAKWEREATDVPVIDGVPLTRYWLIPPEHRPRVYTPHPLMTPEELRSRTQRVWDRFYTLPLVWQRSRILKGLRARVAFVLVSKLYRQMYANTGIATDSARVSRSVRRARLLARMVRRLFMAAPMPHLEEPMPAPSLARARPVPVRVGS